jgi:hypothetical protein
MTAIIPKGRVRRYLRELSVSKDGSRTLPKSLVGFLNLQSSGNCVNNRTIHEHFGKVLL